MSPVLKSLKIYACNKRWPQVDRDGRTGRNPRTYEYCLFVLLSGITQDREPLTTLRTILIRTDLALTADIGPWSSHWRETFPATAVEYKAAPNKQSGFEVHHHMVNSSFWNLLLLKILSDIQESITSWKPNFNSNFGKSGCLQWVTSEREAPLPQGNARASPKAQLHKYFQLSKLTYQLLVHTPMQFSLHCQARGTSQVKNQPPPPLLVAMPAWSVCRKQMLEVNFNWPTPSTLLDNTDSTYVPLTSPNSFPQTHERDFLSGDLKAR